MSLSDYAEYVGDKYSLLGMTADVKPDPNTHHLELSERKLYARFHGGEGSEDWTLYPASDFKLLVPITL